MLAIVDALANIDVVLVIVANNDTDASAEPLLETLPLLVPDDADNGTAQNAKKIKRKLMMFRL